MAIDNQSLEVEALLLDLTAKCWWRKCLRDSAHLDFIPEGFLIDNKDGGERPIIGFRNLNKFIQVSKFK